ncbi:MAG: histidinol-phosphatase [Rhodospirillales bacterium]|nr:histidinol-phosphatase [Rhodospirillales bacterium]
MRAKLDPAPCPEHLIGFAERLATAAGEVVRRHFRGGLEVHDKADATPVTLADREAEAEIRRLIAESHPAHGVVGEEQGSDRPDAEYVWVVDPIDGTKRFITGNPLFGTLIALLRDGRPILGVIEMTLLGERWIGAAGRPTVLREGAEAREVRVRPCPSLGQAVLAASSPHMFDEQGEFPAFERVRKAAKMALYGGDCFNYGTLACGYIDLVVEADMAAYDFMALVPVVAGAGGVVTDWQGAALGLETRGQLIAAGDRRVHEAALELLGRG